MRKIPGNTGRLTGRRGAVLPIVVITMVILLGLAAFAVDLGYMYVAKGELQNAADAAALAGASVLFTDNRNCLASGSPYCCCTGQGTGSCTADTFDDNCVIKTAQAAAVLNKSGGNSVPTPTVEVGHYAFAADPGSPGAFTQNGNTQQLQGWETISFSSLNSSTDFINAVRVTESRTDVPAFFSRIFGDSVFTVTVQAIAYVGFAGTLQPWTLNEPISVCKSSIVDSNGNYSCAAGNILSSGNTVEWTNLTQPCSTASASSVNALICKNGPTGSVNSGTILLGQGLGTTNGTQGINVSAGSTNIQTCFQAYEAEQSTPQPWPLILPVVDCAQGCSPVVGAVEVRVVWVTGDGSDPHYNNAPQPRQQMYDPNTNTTWACPDSCGTQETMPAGECCWDGGYAQGYVNVLPAWSFVANFNLQYPVGTPAPYQQKTAYFLPDCTPHAPEGTTGGENFGIMAQYPVLVK